METFLSVIFWIIFIYYLIRIILRYLVPFLLVRFFKKMESRMGASQSQYDTTSREGEIKVNYEPGNNPKVSSDIGEYVDFEEIKEKPKS